MTRSNRYSKIIIQSVAALALCYSQAHLSAQEFSVTQVTQWHPYLEWEIVNESYDGNPYDVVATVTYLHSSGAQHNVPMYYAGDNTWKWRFTGSKLGSWNFTSSSTDADLNGHIGSINVLTNPDSAARGFLTAINGKWAWSGSGQAFIPNYLMWGGNSGQGIRYFGEDQSIIDRMIEEFIYGHGFTGFMAHGMGQWFDVNLGQQTHGDPAVPHNAKNPDPRSLDAFEVLITKTYLAGGHIHFWCWGDQQRGQTPQNISGADGGLNGVVDRRLQRYIAGRLGPLPGWSMGYGFDVDEWDPTAAHGHVWRSNMRSLCTYPRFYGSRPADPNRGGNHQTPHLLDWNEHFDYDSYEHHLGNNSNEKVYANYFVAMNESSNKPAFSEDRNRIGTRGKDVSEQQTREFLWLSAMAGGGASIWGHREPGTDLPTKSYGNKHELKTFQKFFFGTQRFLVDMERANALSADSNTWVLVSDQTQSLIAYREGAVSIQLDLSQLGGTRRAIAVDTTSAYTEIDLGILSAQTQTISLPHRSNWALAIGEFIDPSMVGSRPVIEQIGAENNPVVGTSTRLAVTASDPDGDTMMQQWSITEQPDGAAAQLDQGNNPTITFDKPGSYRLQVVVTDEDGNSASESFVLPVQQIPQRIEIQP